MKKEFIQLTTLENQPIIIGLANIVSIETNPDNLNNTEIIFNARKKNMWPKNIFVKESLEQIKN